MIDALGWPRRRAAENIRAMKQVRKIIGLTISAAGLVVLAAGLV
ncbi:hypothetical protein [Variovorax sp. OV329]|nr:hypothetical protein [Variovorax sp. OV329]